MNATKYRCTACQGSSTFKGIRNIFKRFRARCLKCGKYQTLIPYWISESWGEGFIEEK